MLSVILAATAPMKSFRYDVLGLLCVGLLLASCSTTSTLSDDPASYAQQIRVFEERVQRNPDDADALSDLGALYLRTSRVPEATERLERAYALTPDAPKTQFYYGLAHETQGRIDEALALYSQFAEAPRRSQYRRLLRGRYDYVVRQQTRQEIETLVASEAELGDTDDLSPRVVAVFPLSYRGQRERFRPLGRGLGEMMLVDLANVNELQVVERIRLQALLDELALGESDLVAPGTAPRTGRLLQAGRVTSGSYDVLGEDDLRLDVLLWNADRPTSEFPSQSAMLSNFFRLEKQIVFDLIADMGIELTPEERAQIEYIPTQNLQAFLAYSQGLERQDAGDFAAAARFFQQAAEIDPSFSEAAEKAEEMESLDLAQGTTLTVLQTALQRFMATGPTINLMDERVQHIGDVTGTLFTPSLNPREPAEEAAGSALGRLPDPPPPPTRGGGNQ